MGLRVCVCGGGGKLTKNLEFRSQLVLVNRILRNQAKPLVRRKALRELNALTASILSCF